MADLVLDPTPVGGGVDDAEHAAGDPHGSLDRFAAHLTSALDTFAELPATLTPYEVERACAQVINGVIRTSVTLATLRERAADNPESAAFDAPIARLSALIARAQTRLAELEARRQPERIPWLQRLQVLDRYEATLARLYLTQARSQEQHELRQARRQRRLEQAQQRELARQIGKGRQMAWYLRGGQAPTADTPPEPGLVLAHPEQAPAALPTPPHPSPLAGPPAGTTNLPPLAGGPRGVGKPQKQKGAAKAHAGSRHKKHR
jgi:hypothetical protein